jgi:cytochrome c556
MRRRDRTASIALGALTAGLLAAAAASSHVHKEDLPAGPIRNRHELMEEIGSNAKVIGDALKAGKTDGVAGAAEAIRAAAGKIPGLFPPGSTHEKSRAKPEIWDKWDRFTNDAGALAREAGALAATAGQGDLAATKKASGQMFDACKSCHDAFRLPED